MLKCYAAPSFIILLHLFVLGGFGVGDSSHQSGYDGGYTWEQDERSYEDIFRGVQADADIIAEAWKLYSDDLKEEIADVYEVNEHSGSTFMFSLFYSTKLSIRCRVLRRGIGGQQRNLFGKIRDLFLALVYLLSYS